MKLTKESKVLVVIYVLTSLFWFYFLVISGHNVHGLGYYFQIPLAIIPLVGGIFGIKNAQKWGGFKSVMGKSVMALSLGVFTWGIGMIFWNYYIFIERIEVPYPSLADAFFILSWPLWSYGMFELSRATGAKFGLRDKDGKLLLLLIPVFVAVISYYLLFVIARGGEFDTSSGGLKFFFDLFYPIGDIVILSVTALVYSLSRKFLGGKYKPVIIILFIGFVLNYITDFTFSYTTTVETYFNGHYVDFMFSTTISILSLAMSQFNPEMKD